MTSRSDSEPSMTQQDFLSNSSMTLPDPRFDRCDVNLSFSDNLASILGQINCTLLISTYKTGNLVAVSQHDGRIIPAFHTFDRPMGMAVKDSGIAVGTRSQVWFLRSAPDIAAKAEPRGRYDACFLPRYAHFTGDIRCHDLAWVGNELWIVNTLFSCLCSLHPSYNFAPRWRPSFISALAPEDRCHLNGLAVSDGRAHFVSAMSQTDTERGWRAVKRTDGCLIDIATGCIIANGLTMPHSPRVVDGKLYFLHSGFGHLEQVDPASGRREVVCALPGYTRGLVVAGSLAFVGLSKVRATSDLDGVPITSDPERLRCGVWVVDINLGRIVGLFEFNTGIDELFDVQLLPNVKVPLLNGPLDDRPLWTVMPSM